MKQDQRRNSRYRISICNREAPETKHWLRMIAVRPSRVKDDITPAMERNARVEPDFLLNLPSRASFVTIDSDHIEH